MRVKLPRYLIAAMACLLLGVATGTGAAAQPQTGSLNPSAAASACAARQLHAVEPNGPTSAKLSVLVSCELRVERRQLGLGYAQSAPLSRLLDGALKQLTALPYLTRNQPQLAQQAEQSAGHDVIKAFCVNAGPGVSRGSWEFANRRVPPALTALQVANVLARSLKPSDTTARAANAEFGVATRPGLLFRNGKGKGLSIAVIAVTCS